MAATHIETERKFEGGDADTRLSPCGLPGVAGVVPAPDEELDAVYYDTADLRLLARGATLRRRAGGHDAGWHLKRGAGGDRREEIQVEETDDDAVPDELLVRVKALARGEPLVPVLRMRTRREREHLVDADGAPVAEVAHDHVSAEVLEGAPGSGTRVRGKGRRDPGRARRSGRTVSWTELEVELEGAEPVLLDAVEEQLNRFGWSRSRSASKTARVFENGTGPRAGGSPGGGKQRGAPRPGSAGAAVHARLVAQVRALVAADAGVRLDEDEAVHDMRVATRRLRGLLRSYRRLFDRGVTDPVGDELKWLGQVLGTARDHEVLAERLKSRADAVAGRLRGSGDADGADPAAATVAEAGAHCHAAETAAYHRAHARALRTLDTKRYYRLLDRLDAMAAEPPLRPRARRDAARELRRTIKRERRRLKDRVTKADATPGGGAHDRALHEARKAAKRARYAAEAAVPVTGKAAKRFTKRTKRVQQLLGEHQDAVVTRAALIRIAERARVTGADTFPYGVLYAAEHHAAAQAAKAFPKAWKRTGF